jgi:muconolactone D-isomerase
MEEFLVEIATTIPEGTDPAEGELRSIGVWRAADEGELHEKVLGTLPLRSWMTLTVTALESHPNDPGKIHGKA